MAELWEDSGLQGGPRVSARGAGRMEETGRQKWPPDQEGRVGGRLRGARSEGKCLVPRGRPRSRKTSGKDKWCDSLL